MPLIGVCMLVFGFFVGIGCFGKCTVKPLYGTLGVYLPPGVACVIILKYKTLLLGM